MSIADNIRKLRKDNGLTQTQFAEKIGKKRPTVAAWEENRATPSMVILKEIADIFNVPATELAFGTEHDVKDECREMVELLKNELDYNKSLVERLMNIVNGNLSRP